MGGGDHFSGFWTYCGHAVLAGTEGPSLRRAPRLYQHSPVPILDCKKLWSGWPCIFTLAPGHVDVLVVLIKLGTFGKAEKGIILASHYTWVLAEFAGLCRILIFEDA